ncbi:MAG: hypothetical protein QOH00_760 [Gaiellales bacterium]|jgi:peptidoglycan/xylan/chitin deacetylase (PgdA/CDA1 family)|nr:hypothetical protein [Gaiellales bacterium]
MAYLAEHGFTCQTVTELTTRTSTSSGNCSLKHVALTFDDAFADFTHAALPQLLRHEFSATLYVPTAFVGRKASWLDAHGEGDRLVLSARELVDLPANVERGSHGHTHRALDLLPTDQARRDIVFSKQELEQMLGRSVHSFAYPYGFATRTTRRIVAEAGFRSGCAVRYRAAAPGDDAFYLPRIVVGPHTTTGDLAKLLQGAAAPGASHFERWRSGVWRFGRASAALALNR